MHHRVPQFPRCRTTQLTSGAEVLSAPLVPGVARASTDISVGGTVRAHQWAAIRHDGVVAWTKTIETELQIEELPMDGSKDD